MADESASANEVSQIMFRAVTNTTMTTYTRNKIILAGFAAILCATVVWATYSYRHHHVGVDTLNLPGLRITEQPIEDEGFITRPIYRHPFSDTTLPRERNTFFANIASADTLLQSTLRGAWNASLLRKNRSPYAGPAGPTWTGMKSVRANGMPIVVSNEAILDRSDDPKSIGYTGQRKLAEDSEGRVLLAYRKRFGDSYQIFATELDRYADGYIQVLQAEPVSMGTVGITQRVPSIVFDSKDLLHVAWYGSSEPDLENRRQIMHTHTKSSYNVWNENSLTTYVEGYLDEFDMWQEHPSITVDEYDRLFVVWEGKDDDHDNQQIKFSRSFDEGATWSDWVNVHPQEVHAFSRPTMVYTPQSGTLHLFAYSNYGATTENPQIQYSYSTNMGTTWSPWHIVSSGVQDARHISATVVAGIPVITYRTVLEPNGPTQIVYQAVQQEEIGTATAIHASDSYQFFPSVTHIRDSTMFCTTWIEEDSPSEFPNDNPTDGDIYFACRDLFNNNNQEAYNLTPLGSHLYPNLAEESDGSRIPLAYYDDDSGDIVFRLIRLY